MRHFNFIHIGKCGGSTVKQSLTTNKKKFSQIHCGMKNIIQNKKKYIIAVRDPITRFVSAFNWKMYQTTIKKASTRTRPNEVSGFNYWKTVNNLAENIFNKDGTLNNVAYSFIKNDCNHLEYDINYYLEHTLPYISKSNCIIIRQEHLNKDMKKKMNVNVTVKNKDITSYKKPDFSTHLSKSAIRNLRKILENDYKCIKILKDKKLIPEKYYNDILSEKFVKEYCGADKKQKRAKRVNRVNRVNRAKRTITNKKLKAKFKNKKLKAKFKNKKLKAKFKNKKLKAKFKNNYIKLLRKMNRQKRALRKQKRALRKQKRALKNKNVN